MSMCRKDVLLWPSGPRNEIRKGAFHLSYRSLRTLNTAGLVEAEGRCVSFVCKGVEKLIRGGYREQEVGQRCHTARK